MKIIDRSHVLSVKYNDDPDNYDQRLQRLGGFYEEFIVLNPDVDPKIIDCIDVNEKSHALIVWSKDDIWVAKKFHKNWHPRLGWKIYDLKFGITTKNPKLPSLFPKIDFDIKLENYVVERHYEHVWYLDSKFNPTKEKVWVYKYQSHNNILGTKNMGHISPDIPQRLDVFFLSYHEPNAERNYQRLLEICPYARRVSDIDGILNAHQEIARSSETDMFYVVDGDAWVRDGFNFDFQPDIFNRDCTYIWMSYNKITNTIYGNGGIKLLNKQSVLNFQHDRQLDFATNFTNKIKIMTEIGSENCFASDPFHAWKGAFRETVKLLNQQYDQESASRLAKWKNIEITNDLSKFAALGVEDAERYFASNSELTNINDPIWLKKYFLEYYA